MRPHPKNRQLSTARLADTRIEGTSALAFAVLFCALGCSAEKQSSNLPRNAASTAGHAAETTNIQTHQDPPAAARDPRWAKPLAKPGLPNLHEVTKTLLRGAQPEVSGFKELHTLGVKTIVNLRNFHSDQDEIREIGLAADALRYVPIDVNAWALGDQEVLRFLKVAVDPSSQPVFVHCQHGADRTGTAVAAYRIVVQGWTKDDAIREMQEGGFGYHSVWTNLPQYLRELDVAKMRKDLGLEAPAGAAPAKQNAAAAPGPR